MNHNFREMLFGGENFFDHYGTIRELIEIEGVTLEVLKRWANRIRKMDFFYRQEINGKQFVVVHAGYIESLAGVDTDDTFDTLEDILCLEALSRNRRFISHICAFEIKI